jgi:hypothetical protein
MFRFYDSRTVDVTFQNGWTVSSTFGLTVLPNSSLPLEYRKDSVNISAWNHMNYPMVFATGESIFRVHVDTWLRFLIYVESLPPYYTGLEGKEWDGRR